MLALAMMVFAAAPWIWLSVAAAFAVGMACLMAGALTRSLLIECAGVNDVQRQAAVMAAWAVAWAGSKPIASLVDGSLAGWIGVRPTGALLAVPGPPARSGACPAPRHGTAVGAGSILLHLAGRREGSR